MVILLQAQFTDGLSWPSISFAILVASLLLSSYVLYRRFRSRQLLMQRVAELEALSAAGRAIVAAELDVMALCELISQEAGQVIDNSTFQIGLFEDTFYHILFWTINGRRQATPRTFNLSDESGLVGWVRQTRQPLLVQDFSRDLHKLPARPRYISDSPPRSAIFIPLISGDEVIGIMAAQSNQPNHFDEEDLRRLMILANQSAAAIAHARLYDQERRRAAHLELVSQVALQVNAISDLDEIFSQVVRLTRETFGYHPVTIFGLDAETGDAVVEASSAAVPAQGARLARGEGIVGTAAATQETIVCNNTNDDKRFIVHLKAVEATITPDTKAEIAIPLIVGGDVLGVLDVQSPQEGVFNATEVMALETLAAEVAIAIDKARQLARQREQAWMTTAQLQVAEAVSYGNDLEEISTAVTRLTAMLAGASICGILLWDEETGHYYGSALHGVNSQATEAFKRLRLAIGDWGALDAVHVGQTALATRRLPPILRRCLASNGTRPGQLELLPISTKSQRLGVLLVNELEATAVASNRRYKKPIERQQELLQNITHQTAQALESTQLRIAQQEEAWVNTALLQVAEAVNNLIDLNEILDTIVRLVPMLVGVESALILIWDEARQVFQAGPSHGVSKMGRGLIETLEIDLSELAGITQGDLVAHGAVAPSTMMARSAGVRSSGRYSMQHPPWMTKVLGTRSGSAFPLVARGRLVGALLAGIPSHDGRPLSARRLNILNGIAHQAATAVVNNQLYKEAAERSRMEQELNVAREIQASLIPPGSPKIAGCSVASFWQAARQVSGDFYDFLQLSNRCWGIVVADVADKGVPAALFMALSRTILRTVAFNREDPGEVLQRVNEIIDKDTQSDLFVTLVYAIWQPRTETLLYANAGHNPPLLLRQQGRPTLLKGTGIALGVLPIVQIESRSVKLRDGDTLIFYTDGVTETMNEDNDEFGVERLRLAAESARHLDAAGIMQAITDAIGDHAGSTPQFDDITLVVIKRQGSG